MSLPRVFFLLLCLLPLSAIGASLQREVELGLVAGAAFIRYEDIEEWVPAESGMPVTEGDQIRVDGGGRVEIRVRGGAVVRLDEESTVDILALEKGFVQLFMPEGDLHAILPGGKRVGLEIETPFASLRAASKAVFRLSISGEEDAAEIAVSRGEVYVDSIRGGWKVTAGKSLYLEEGNNEFGPLDPPDEWDLWNRERDLKEGGAIPGDRLP